MTKNLSKKAIKFIVMILFTITLIMYYSNSASAASNLIINGDFENDPEYYGNWKTYSTDDNSDFIWGDDVFHGISGKSISIQGDNTSSFFCNTITVEPNQVYTFSAWKKAQDVVANDDKAGTSIAIVQLDSSRNIIDSTMQSVDEEGTFDWKQVSYNFVTNTDTESVFVALVLEGSGSVWYDDISLTASGDSIPAAWSSVEAIPGIDRSTFVGFDVKLDGTNSIGNSLNYQWRLISKPAGSLCELNKSDTVNSDFKPDVSGDYTIGLTVSDGVITSKERTITIRAKEISDTSDDICYTQMNGSACIEGYKIGGIVPLSDGWVILSDVNKNKVFIVNGITGEIAKEYQLNATPTDIIFDFDNNFIIATQNPTNSIAKINVMNDEISYINTYGAVKKLTMGESNTAFAYSNNNCISIIDLIKNTETKTNANADYIGCIKYDKVYHNLFLGVEGVSPSSLYKYNYDVQNQSLNYIEYNWDAGSDGKDLAISSDGKHLVFACGTGNGTGYDTYDFDSSSITKSLGLWHTGPYPVSADFSSDNKYLVATNCNKTMLFDVITHTLVREISFRDDNFYETSKVRFSKGDSIVFSCDKDNYHNYTDKIYLDKTDINSSVDSVTLDSVIVDNTAPMAINDELNITIDAIGGSDKQYGFLIYDGNSWSTLQAYSENKSFTWKPSDPGIYTIVTEVKDKNSSNDYDDLYVMNYEVYIPDTAPVANINSGNVLTGTSISLSMNIPDSKIYYTLDGTTPTEASTLYTDPIIITKAVTINAIAISNGISSTVSTYNYTIAPQVATPVANPTSGSVVSGTEITLKTLTDGAMIYYTLDGTTPTTKSTIYTAPIKITSATTINAIAVKPNMSNSNMLTATYEVYIPDTAPVANINSGNVLAGTSISLSMSIPDSKIYYTLDGTTPTEASTLYTDPIIITKAVTINAIAISNGISSTVSTYNYTIAPQVATPVANPTSGSVVSGTEITLKTLTDGAMIYFTLDGTTPTIKSTIYTAPIKITSATTINAIAVKPNMSNSNMLTATYQISSPIDNGSTGGGIPGGIPSGMPSGGAATGGYTKMDQNTLFIAGIPKLITVGDNKFDLGTTGGSGTGSVSYKVTSGNAISISGNTVTILKAGNATITATKESDSTFNSITATVNINVNKSAVKIETLPTVEGTADFGSSLSTVVMIGGKSNVSGKFVWNSPKLKLKKTGYYEITFIPSDTDNYSNETTYNGEFAKIKVVVSVEPETLIFKTTTKTIALDQTYKQEAIVDDGRKDVIITYSSSKKSVATVNSEGIVTPKKVGTTYITAKTNNGLTSTYKIVVKKAPIKITLSHKSNTIIVGKTVTLKPSVGEGYYADYTFTSSNKNVATVSKNGNVIAKKAGTTIITIKTYNGLVITYEIRVKEK